jgi:hypothetical protein
MSKEKLITEFKGQTFSSNEQVIKWIEKAIDQTREETIRKVEEMMPNRDEIVEDPIGYLERLEEELNKLKK